MSEKSRVWFVTGCSTGFGRALTQRILAGTVRQTQKVSECPPPRPSSGCAKLTPLQERGGATVLECLSAGEVAVLIEVVVDRAVEGCEFLQTSHPPEPRHVPFPSSKWEM